jgi:hypothetical protein
MDFVPELTSKILGNSCRFLTTTHMTLSAKRFRGYGIWTIDVAAEFCFWTEQRQNVSLVSSPGLAETPEVPHTISVDNCVRFLMVH